MEFGDGGYMILHHQAPGNLVQTTVIPAASSAMVPYHVHPVAAEYMTVIKGELHAVREHNHRPVLIRS